MSTEAQPMEIEKIARVCYEANRTYALTLGDQSFVPWDDAPEWQRTTNIKGVRFAIENPTAGPQASHVSWLAEKRAAGWTYGPVKDPEKREHPCCLDYDQLPEAQRRKDVLFLAVVRALADASEKA